MPYFSSMYPREIRLMCIDPGTSTLGLGVIVANLDTRRVHVMHVQTLKSTKEVDHDHILTHAHGARMVKIEFLKATIYKSLCQFAPSMVIAEAPFMGRFAQSYAALVEVRKGIVEAVAAYNPGMFFETIEPLNVKAAVGVILNKQSRKDKNAVRKALFALPNLSWDPYIDPASLDEHSIDAIAVGYWKASQLFALME